MLQHDLFSKAHFFLPAFLQHQNDSSRRAGQLVVKRDIGGIDKVIFSVMSPGVNLLLFFYKSAGLVNSKVYKPAAHFTGPAKS